MSFAPNNDPQPGSPARAPSLPILRPILLNLTLNRKGINHIWPTNLDESCALKKNKIALKINEPPISKGMEIFNQKGMNTKYSWELISQVVPKPPKIEGKSKINILFVKAPPLSPVFHPLSELALEKKI